MSNQNGERTLHDWMRHLDTKIDLTTNRLERRLAVIDGKLDKKEDKEVVNLVRKRVGKLEEFSNRAKGILAFLTLVGGIAFTVWASGCAHQHVRTFYPTGEPECDLVTTVIGGGTISVLVEDEICPDTIYESTDTGITDNGKEVITEAVEAGVRAAIPGLP